MIAICIQVPGDRFNPSFAGDRRRASHREEALELEPSSAGVAEDPSSREAELEASGDEGWLEAPVWPPSSRWFLRALQLSFHRARPAHVTKVQLRRLLDALSPPPQFFVSSQEGDGSAPPMVPIRFFDDALTLEPLRSMLWWWPEAELSPIDREALAVLLEGLNHFRCADFEGAASLLEERIEPMDAAGLGQETRGRSATRCAAQRGLEPAPTGGGWGETGIESDLSEGAMAVDSLVLAGRDPIRVLRSPSSALSFAMRPLEALNSLTLTREVEIDGGLAPVGPGGRIDPVQTPRFQRFNPFQRPVAGQVLRALQAASRGSLASPQTSPNAQSRGALQVVRYRLDSSHLPRLEDALFFCERVRSALIRLRSVQGHSPVLTGKTLEGRPLKGNGHAHFLGTDEDGDGCIDHLTVYAPEGFDADDLEAFGRLRMLTGRGSMALQQLELEALGDRTTVATAPLFQEACRWRSATPFSLPRYASRGEGKAPRPRDLPEAQLRRELRTRGIAEPRRVQRLEQDVRPDGTSRAWETFQTRRFKGTQGYGLAGFVLEFDRPVVGPIAVGFGCNFGLGLFLPLEADLPSEP